MMRGREHTTPRVVIFVVNSSPIGQSLVQYVYTILRCRPTYRVYDQTVVASRRLRERDDAAIVCCFQLARLGVARHDGHSGCHVIGRGGREQQHGGRIPDQAGVEILVVH